MKRYLLICALMGPLSAFAAPVPEWTEDGFRVPQPGAELPFPRSHAAHPDYKIEWWYLTGHLEAEDGRRFGYQATFFRSALKAPAEQDPGAFGLNHLYLTHMALSDIEGQAFHYDARLGRDGWDAWAKEDTLDVRNGPWSLKSTTKEVDSLRLEASANESVRWSLELSPLKPIVRFGEDGTSIKGEAPEARSYYLSFTRLQSEGTLFLDGEAIAVRGLSWMDHEIASNQLDPSYEGWDWIAIQLEDGWEVKAYLLRQADGSPAAVSAFIWINPAGQHWQLGPEDFSWEKGESWKSPHSGASYPTRLSISAAHPVTRSVTTFHYTPLIEDQELVFSGTTYWEGAGSVSDNQGKEIGAAYLELVGYAGPIEGLR
jgi:predicted secreted hydrolase